MVFTALLSLFPQDDPLQAERIRTLLVDLGSEDPARREQATRELTLMGHQAAKSVEEAFRIARNPEGRKRLEDLARFLGAAEPVTEEGLRARRVDFEIPRGKAVAVFRDLTQRFHVPIEVLIEDADLQERKFVGASLQEIFGYLARQLDARWQIVGGRKVTFVRDPAPGGKGTLKLYDVSALTFRILDMPGHVFDGEDGIVFIDEPAEAQPQLGGEDLVELVRGSVAKETWDEEDRSLCFRNGLLIVRTSEEVHAKIETFLAQVRRNFALQVRFEMLAVAHAPAFQAELLGQAPRLLTEEQLEEILKAASEGDQASLVGRIELTCFQNQRISSHSGTERTYVSHYAEGKPIRRSLFEGLRADIKPTVSHDRKTAKVKILARLSRTLSIDRIKTVDGEIEAPKRSTVPIKLTPTVECVRPVVLLQTGPVDGFGGARTQVLVILRVTPVSPK
jgi:hypothetical protein